MRSAVFCYAPQDAGFARDLGGFLERNCPVEPFYDEGLVRPGCDLIDAAARALSAELAILLLSPDSVPPVWKRDKWGPVLFDSAEEFGTHVVFVLLRNCKFPELFRRKRFFDASRDSLAAWRALKRWTLTLGRPSLTTFGIPARTHSHEPASGVLDELHSQLSDRPGCATCVGPDTALAFVQAAEDDFEGIFWVDCAGRSRAGILGDIGHALGLRLAGPLDQNSAALQDFFVTRRCLLVLEHVPPAGREVVAFGGKTSVVFVNAHAAPERRSLKETIALFSRWTERSNECLAALGDAQAHLESLLLQPEASADAAQLGSAVVALLRNCDRLAEADEVLDILAQARRATGDTMALHRILWEQSWIREHWGEPVSHLPALLPEPEQLTLGFSDPIIWRGKS